MAKAKTSTRARLDRQMIIDAGIELAETGVATISVRDLGAHLGADPTAIYRHFPSKDAVMIALLDELHARSVSSVVAPAEDWEVRLRALALATLEAFTRYPAIGAEATTLTTHGPGELSAIELMLDAFHRAGLRDQDLVRHYALLASHILSDAAGIARASGARAIDDPDSPWLDAPLLVDPRRHPLIAEHGVLLSGLKDNEIFHLGVEMIIDSAKRTAAA